MAPLEQDTLRHALDSARQGGYRVVRLRSGDEVFSAVLSQRDEAEEEFFDEPVEEVAAPATFAVTSPVVGYYKASKAWKKGQVIESGQTVAEIVALGIANDVVAHGAGKIEKVHVKDGDPVEFGQELFTVTRS